MTVEARAGEVDYQCSLDIDVDRYRSGVFLTTTPNPSVFSQPVIATVDVNGVNATGMVTVSLSGMILGGAAVVDSRATFPLDFQNFIPSRFDLQVSYCGDANNMPALAMSGAWSHFMRPAQTRARMQITPVPRGQPIPVAVSITVLPPAIAPVPERAASFYVDGNNVVPLMVEVHGETTTALLPPLLTGQHIIGSSWFDSHFEVANSNDYYPEALFISGFE